MKIFGVCVICLGLISILSKILFLFGISNLDYAEGHMYVSLFLNITVTLWGVLILFRKKIAYTLGCVFFIIICIMLLINYIIAFNSYYNEGRIDMIIMATFRKRFFDC